MVRARCRDALLSDKQPRLDKSPNINISNICPTRALNSALGLENSRPPPLDERKREGLVLHLVCGQAALI